MAYALLGCNGLMALVFFLRHQTFPPQIPLFFSHSAGEDQLGEWWMIFILPLFMNVLFFLNNLIASRFFPGNGYVRKVIQYLNIGIMVSLTVIFIKIVFLVS